MGHGHCRLILAGRMCVSTVFSTYIVARDSYTIPIRASAIKNEDINLRETIFLSSSVRNWRESALLVQIKETDVVNQSHNQLVFSRAELEISL